MRIVYLHQHFATPDMVGGTRSYEMARRLVEAGHQVHMVAAQRSGQGHGWTETEEAGIRVHWCPVAYSNQMSFARRIQSFLDFSWRSAHKAAGLPCDVIFASSTPLTIALPAAYARWRTGAPMIFEVRDLWPDTPVAVGALKHRLPIALACRLERFAYEQSCHVVALSPDMKRGVVAAGYPADCVSVIPNSSDLALFDVPPEQGQSFRQRHAWLQDRPLVVYTGTLGLVNGVDYLARLAAAVARIDDEIRFLVIGDGREREKVHRAAEELNVLNRNFFMFESVPKREMPVVLSAADLATSTVIDRQALWANSANKVFDALAAGRPIAINHEGWLAEMIRETGCGMVLPAHDLEEGAQRLVATLNDREATRTLRNAARQVARERFDRDRLAQKLETVIRTAAEQPNGRVTTADLQRPVILPIPTNDKTLPAHEKAA